MPGLLSRLLMWLDHDPWLAERDWRAEAIERRIEVEVLRQLVLSMALGLPRDHLPDLERTALDEITGGPQ
jgi:hypothetical protein